MLIRKLFIVIISILFVYLYCIFSCDSFETFNSVDNIPTVSFPFKNLYDENNSNLNIILIAAPLREKKHEDLYEKYKKMGLKFCGISSYLSFPDKIDNPYEDKYHVERKHNYVNMVSCWLHCFRVPPKILSESKLPLLLLTEADLKDYNRYKPSMIKNKEYDFMYICLKDNDKCEPGWQSYNRNWELAKKCLEVLCGKYKLKGLLVGRENCKHSDTYKDYITNIGFLPYDMFQKEMEKCRFLFVPNVSDASPRVITEALCYNMPVMVNYNIFGGWHNVIPGVTGEFFINENDISKSINTMLKNMNSYTPRKWFIENRGMDKSGKVLADFLIKNYPDINNKKMDYATISI
jgi:hypothetical protein